MSLAPTQQNVRPIEQDRSHSLAILSDLAGRRLGTTSDATDAVLRAISDVLDMRTTWVSQIDRSCSDMLVVASHNEPGGCDFPPGVTVPLPDTF